MTDQTYTTADFKRSVYAHRADGMRATKRGPDWWVAANGLHQTDQEMAGNGWIPDAAPTTDEESHPNSPTSLDNARKYIEALQRAVDTEKTRAEKAEQERDHWKREADGANADLAARSRGGRREGDPVTGHIDRDALRKLADAATPGPWEDDGREVAQHWSRPEPWRTIVGTEVACGSYCLGGTAEGIGRTEDAAFIAAARTAVPALLDAIDQAEAERDYRRRENAELVQQVKDERGAALDQLEQVRIRDARIADALGYCGLVDEHPNLAARPGFVAVADIRRALDGEPNG